MKLKTLTVEIESIEYTRSFREFADKKRTNAEINAAVFSITEEITNNNPTLMLSVAKKEARKEVEAIFSSEEIDRNNLMELDSIKNNISHYRFWIIEKLIQDTYKINW